MKCEEIYFIETLKVTGKEIWIFVKSGLFS